MSVAAGPLAQLGIGLSMGLAGVHRAVPIGVGPHDVVGPARRAICVDPLVALRE